MRPCVRLCVILCIVVVHTHTIAAVSPIEEEGWAEALRGEALKPYFDGLQASLDKEYGIKVIYPPGQKLFNAFERCP